MLTEGERVPDLTLESDSGKKVRLRGFAGKQLVVYFYPKDDTPGCTREGIAFSQLASEFAKAKTTVVGISRDSAAAHCKFRDKHGLTVPLLVDTDKAAHLAFGAWGEKVLYGKKSEGAIRCTFLIGADGKVKRVWKSVKVDGHAEQVLAAARGGESAPFASGEDPTFKAKARAVAKKAALVKSAGATRKRTPAATAKATRAGKATRPAAAKKAPRRG
jgi:peroxiredoxin Q/BCP